MFYFSSLFCLMDLFSSSVLTNPLPNDLNPIKLGDVLWLPPFRPEKIMLAKKEAPKLAKAPMVREIQKDLN